MTVSEWSQKPDMGHVSHVWGYQSSISVSRVTSHNLDLSDIRVYATCFMVWCLGWGNQSSLKLDASSAEVLTNYASFYSILYKSTWPTLVSECLISKLCTDSAYHCKAATCTLCPHYTWWQGSLKGAALSSTRSNGAIKHWHILAELLGGGLD